MAHIVLIEDKNGDVIDANWYCSDYCAQTDNSYAGWYGAQVCELDTPCNYCRKPIDSDKRSKDNEQSNLHAKQQ